MFDIHYHLVYGVDDGPKTIDASLQLAEASIGEGVTHIVATPHANDEYPLQPELNRKVLEILQKRLSGRLTLGLGCDFHLSIDNIQDLFRDPSKYTINGKSYLLVEFAELVIPPRIGATFHEMLQAGVVPIITHPERNAVLRERRDLLAEWIRSGCLVQVTAASLFGRFGRRAEAAARDLIKKNWVHFIASDAHFIPGREPSMRPAYGHIEQHFGHETADRLCRQNPRAAFFGETLPRQPEPAGVFEKAKGGFLSRIFGR